MSGQGISEEDKLKAVVMRILNSDAIRRMRFVVPSGSGEITIDKTSFKKVADAIGDGTVHIAPFPASGSASVGGLYGDDNTLYLRAAPGRVEEAYIVHELVHCYFDVTRTTILDANEEATCITAETLYAKMTNLADKRFSGPLFDEGRAVAIGIVAAEGKGTSSAPRVNNDKWNALISADVASDLYKDTLTATSTTYKHDG